MLFEPGGVVGGGLPHDHQEPRCGKQADQVRQAGDVVVGLGQVALAPVGEQQLADVVAVVALEWWVAGGGVEYGRVLLVVQAREEPVPYRLLDRLRAAPAAEQGGRWWALARGGGG